MPDIQFGSDGLAAFSTKHHGEVTLSKWKWDRICSQPERAFYRFNGDKVATTLINPDEVRHHSHETTQFFYYKAFSSWSIRDGIEAPVPKFANYFAVVIDTNTVRVCTVMPTKKIKNGKKFIGG